MTLLLLALVNCMTSVTAKPLSPSTCAYAVRVAGSGEPEVNGLYYDDTSELSDGVPYYYKWSAKLSDYILLYRDVDTTTNFSNWVIQSLKQLNNQTYVDYYLVSWKIASPHPPASGWTGKVAAPDLSVGRDPPPAIDLIATGGMWDDELEECTRNCSKLPASEKNTTCAMVTVQGAGSKHVNQNFTQTSMTSDCVPYYIASNVTPALVMYRLWYQMGTYWIIQDVDQVAGADFKEWYSVSVASTSAVPAAHGWNATDTLVSSAVGAAPFPSVVFSESCAVTNLTQQQLPISMGITQLNKVQNTAPSISEAERKKPKRDDISATAAPKTSVGARTTVSMFVEMPVCISLLMIALMVE